MRKLRLNQVNYLDRSHSLKVSQPKFKYRSYAHKHHRDSLLPQSPLCSELAEERTDRSLPVWGIVDGGEYGQ